MTAQLPEIGADVSLRDADALQFVALVSFSQKKYDGAENTVAWRCGVVRTGSGRTQSFKLTTKSEKGTETMIPRVGLMLLASTSLMMLTIGCQRAAEQKPLSETEAAKYRQVTVQVTGLT